MVFKPFKSPLIRKPAQDSSTKLDITVDTQVNHGPPAKKPRLHQDRAAGSTSSSTRSDRKPLIQMSNVGESTGENIRDDSSTGEKYFNVLWYDVLINALSLFFIKEEK
jgi:DNA repair and recombination protein RAD54B